MPSKNTRPPWRRASRSIPAELQQIKAYELSQLRLSEGKEPNSDEDWNDAGEYLAKHRRKVLVWKLKKLRRSIKDFRDVCWRAFVFPLWLLWKLPSLFAQADTRAFALDIVKTVITALGLIATFVAGIGLFVNYWSSEKNIQLTQERLVTERFSKAIEQLGSGKDEVILGGIYSLERIAKDSPKDQATIMEVLSAFVRKNSPVSINKDSYKPSEFSWENHQVTITIQAALTVIGRRNQIEIKKNRDLIDLSNTNLFEADLSEANLIGVNLRGSQLREANLYKANLQGSNYFTSEQIKSACYWYEAQYEPGKLDKLYLDKDAVPKNLPYCSRWKTRF
jgi:Pentapeptide repeats (8 copies)